MKSVHAMMGYFVDEHTGSHLRSSYPIVVVGVGSHIHKMGGGGGYRVINVFRNLVAHI